MSDTLALATRLRAMDNAGLDAAIRARGLAPGGIKDFFDLAEAFLDRESIQQTVTRLDRGCLALIAAITLLTEQAADGAQPPTLAQLSQLLGSDAAESVLARSEATAALLLIEPAGDRILAYQAVRDQLRSWPALGLPSLVELAKSGESAAGLENSTGAESGAVGGECGEATPADLDQTLIDRLGAERAFATITTITEMLAELERDPARELAKGGVALPDSKRLALAMGVDLELVSRYLTVAERCRFTARETGSWVITERGSGWLLRSTAARWAQLGSIWCAGLPEDIRHILGVGKRLLPELDLWSYINWLYPAAGEWMHRRIDAHSSEAQLLGVTAQQSPTTPGALLFAGDIGSAETAMKLLLPAEVEQVYLQHDLSVVAPGPLTPRVDGRLRSLADVESRVLAASYRVSASSLNRAMAVGETAESILEFLGSISLTGIPQPLNYLISETAARYGQVRVGSIFDELSEARSYISSTDELLIRAIVVDHSLSSLGLERVSATRAESQFPFETTFWLTSDARYPVAAEDGDGQIVVLRRANTARAINAVAVDPVAVLLQKLRLNGGEIDENGHAWLIRQLDAAIKAKTPLTVSVSMPDGAMVDYQLEPTSVIGGRFRGRDNRAAIERTLPLSRITAISPAL